MRRMAFTAALACGFGATAACTKTDPLFCDDSGNHPCGEGFVCNAATNSCDPVGVEPCDDATDCMASTPYCIVDVETPTENVCSDSCDADPACLDATPSSPYCTAGTCAACGASDNRGCDAASDAPICDDAALDCRACATDDECPSAVCLPDGACADPARLLFASPSGAGDCLTPDSACNIATAVAALSAQRNVIRLLEGSHIPAPQAPLVIDDDATLLGGPTLTEIFREAGSSGDVVEIKAGASVAFWRVDVRGGVGSGDGDAISCTDSSDLRFSNGRISGAPRRGIDGGSCSVSITASTINNNSGGGIAVSNGGATSRIVNNFVYGNGTADPGGTTFGGIDFGGLVGSTIAFNTIVRNRAQDEVTAGLSCSASGLVARNNIVTSNGVGADVQIDGNCNHANTVIGPDQTPDADWPDMITVLPTFVDASNGDFHLTNTSSGHDAALSLDDVATDFEGDLRGLTPDIGADEYVP